ncbi:DUF6090 family protein [Seonamhaeicola maritimus]|uniref:Uncharacterized protein n=1 Tax=Seonamhaeicola maritimus TaxID=2591822 RepID=A0A5C7GK91_9FLAO|nr:DUF6090 family protein [Seonamhaeicola maritimus]TXG38714.1 hypothetical protein FUA22_02175 [Seonamhaeicola maritimus]
MIKFFRNIRKKLLAEGNTGKYLKYAIGEIVLVVFGILIALQINNWNENRKEHKKKIELTHSLIQDLAKDTLKLNQSIEILKSFQSKNKSQVNNLFAPQTNIDSLKQLAFYDFVPHFWGIITEFNIVTFNSLQSTGNIELFHKDIKEEIIKHYNFLENFKLNNDDRDLYFEMRNTYNNKYPYEMGIQPKDNYTNLVRKEVSDEHEFVNLLTNMVMFKNYITDKFIESYNAIKEQTISLINKLKVL